MNEGTITSTSGRSIPADQYEGEFIESHVRHSTALHSRAGDRRVVLRRAAVARESQSRSPFANGQTDGRRSRRRLAELESVPRDHRPRTGGRSRLRRRRWRSCERTSRPGRRESSMNTTAARACAATEAPRGTDLPSLSGRRARKDDLGQDRPPHVAEPVPDRGRLAAIAPRVPADDDQHDGAGL